MKSCWSTMTEPALVTMNGRNKVIEKKKTYPMSGRKRNKLVSNLCCHSRIT